MTRKKSTKRAKAKARGFRSNFEQQVANSIERQGHTYQYEEEKIEYVIPAQKKKYLPDFKVNGIYIEAKGKFDAASRKKMALVIQQNPDLDIRMLFMRDNTITKTSKTRYSDWCEKNGITWAVSANGEVPEEWLS